MRGKRTSGQFHIPGSRNEPVHGLRERAHLARRSEVAVEPHVQSAFLATHDGANAKSFSLRPNLSFADSALMSPSRPSTTSTRR